MTSDCPKDTAMLAEEGSVWLARATKWDGKDDKDFKVFSDKVDFYKQMEAKHEGCVVCSVHSYGPGSKCCFYKTRETLCKALFGVSWRRYHSIDVDNRTMGLDFLVDRKGKLKVKKVEILPSARLKSFHDKILEAKRVKKQRVQNPFDDTLPLRSKSLEPSKGIQLLGGVDSLTERIKPFFIAWRSTQGEEASVIELGSGNGLLAKSVQCSIINVHPKKTRLYAVDTLYTQDCPLDQVIQTRTSVDGLPHANESLMIVVWPEPCALDDNSYDLKAIATTKPHSIILLYDKTGVSGSNALLHWLHTKCHISGIKPWFPHSLRLSWDVSYKKIFEIDVSFPMGGLASLLFLQRVA